MSTPTPPDMARRESGLRLPVPPPPGVDAFDIAMHYLANYEADYGRARRVVKSRASNVVVGVATANGLIAVVGVWLSLCRGGRGSGLSPPAWLGPLAY